MDETLLAKKNINILSIVPDTTEATTDRYIVVFEYQWRNRGRPVWSKDFIRTTLRPDGIREEITERVLELRRMLENGVRD